MMLQSARHRNLSPSSDLDRHIGRVLTRCCSAVCPTMKNRRLRCTADTRSEGRRGGLAAESAAVPPPVKPEDNRAEAGVMLQSCAARWCLSHLL